MKSRPWNSSHSRISRVNSQFELPKSSSLATRADLQGFANDVVDRGLNLLDARNRIRAYHNREIGQPPPDNLAAVVPGKRYGSEAALASLLQRHDNVAR